MKNKIACLIPARSGSKRIKNKNLLKINKKELELNKKELKKKLMPEKKLNVINNIPNNEVSTYITEMVK